MVFSIILERFIEHSPIPVMARSLIERTLNADRINACFDSVDENPQYTRELLFSSVFELMSLVVLRAFPAIPIKAERVTSLYPSLPCTIS